MGSIGNDFNENFTGEKITVNGLLSRIEKNGGANGLDLSGKDLSGIILTPKALTQIRQKKKLKNKPVWQMENGGINLEGVNLSWAKLTRADLSESSLRNADLRGAKLENIDLIDADLSNAILWDASLDYATLDGAILFGANFNGSTVNRENIGEEIIQERQDYSLPREMSMLPERNRFWQASKIYRQLKATYDNNGLYDNASWAYRKARKMERQLAKYHMREGWKNEHWSKVAINFRKYATDTFVEFLSDYGENPNRVLRSIILLWSGFALFYGFLSGVIDSVSTKVTHSAIDLLAFSLGTMTTIGAVGLSANNTLAMRFLMPIETLFGIALTGLFGYVLGNRINRI